MELAALFLPSSQILGSNSTYVAWLRNIPGIRRGSGWNNYISEHPAKLILEVFSPKVDSFVSPMNELVMSIVHDFTSQRSTHTGVAEVFKQSPTVTGDIR